MSNSRPDPFGVPWGTMGYLAASLGFIHSDHAAECSQPNGHEGPCPARAEM